MKKESKRGGIILSIALFHAGTTGTRSRLSFFLFMFSFVICYFFRFKLKFRASNHLFNLPDSWRTLRIMSVRNATRNVCHIRRWLLQGDALNVSKCNGDSFSEDTCFSASISAQYYKGKISSELSFVL